MTVPLAPLSPEWWVSRLYKKLMKDKERVEFFDDYYRGAHPLPWLAPQAREEFRRILKMTRSNYMGLVVDSTAERCQIVDFRVGDAAEGDRDSRRIWQSNNMDVFSDKAILESLIGGRAYLMVAPNPKDDKTPFIWAEHPSQVITEVVPGGNGRDVAAGIKVWIDEWTNKTFATLYLPDFIYKYQADAPPKGSDLVPAPRWEERRVAGEAWPAGNPLGQVPLFELPNNPRLLTGGVSELSDVTDVQDRINKTIADRLMTQDYGAFPQKWAVAWPDSDDHGNPQPKIDVGRNRMVTSDIAETKFGQWDSAPLDPYSAAKREDVKDIASRTRTPAQYLLGELNNVNGQTLKAAESGLISKVRQRQRGYDDGLEDAMIAARKLAGLPAVGNDEIEVMWRNPEYRTDAELVDGLSKMNDLHVPFQILWEKWGATPAEVARWVDLAKKNSSDPTIQKVLGQLADPPIEQIRINQGDPLGGPTPAVPPAPAA